MSAQTVATADILAAYADLGRLTGLVDSRYEAHAFALADSIAAALDVARVAAQGREEAVKTRRRGQTIAARLAAERRAWEEEQARRWEEAEYGAAVLGEAADRLLYGDRDGAAFDC